MHISKFKLCGILKPLLYLFCLSSTTAYAISNSNNLDNQVKKTINGVMHKYTIPGAAVLVYKDGQMHQYVFGVMNNKTKRPVNTKTIFELGSVTKTFSSLLLAEQVNAGTMHLDDSVTTYLDNADTDSASLQKITLLELATHTSALPYNAPNLSYNAALSPQNTKLLNTFLHTWIATYTPGTEVLYSNLGFSILGQALADHAGTSLLEVMQQGILRPLGMKNSYLSIPVEVSKNYASGYTANGTPSRTPQGGLLAGSWAMKSTIEDMAQYLKAALIVDGMPDNIVSAMKIAQTGYFEVPSRNFQIGLGWTITDLSHVSQAELLKVIPVAPRKKIPTPVTKITSPQYITHALIEKTGSTNGFRAYIAVIPDQKIGVVILSNRFIYDPHALQHAGLEILFN